MTHREFSELQRRLVDAGVLSEIKPPITDLAPYRNRRAVPVQGEPVSETVIRERRRCPTLVVGGFRLAGG